MSLVCRFNLHRESFALNVDLDMPDSGVTAIFGPSGSGKTTLLRAIAGLEKIPGGQLSFRGKTWQDKDQFVPAHQRPIGYVFQDARLFPHLTVKQNLEYGLKRIPASERRISLDSAVELLNVGILLSRDPETLSGGEKQRVAIARTLAVSPRLLLMDEPLASLDNKLKLEILPYLETLHRELAIPILYVSHATDEVARLADTLVILRNGEVLGSGPIQNMLARLDLPLSHRLDAETLINATVMDIDQQFGLTRLDCNGHVFTVTGTALAIGSSIRLRIAAQDVSLTLDRQSNTSIQNIFPVTVLEVQEESTAQAMVKLGLAGNPLLARLTYKSIADLGISQGKQVFAQIKSIAVLS